MFANNAGLQFQFCLMQDIYWPTWLCEGKHNKEVENYSLMIAVTIFGAVQRR
jgi:hypothetical protein